MRQNIEDLTNSEFSKGIENNLLALEDKWILSKVNKTIELINIYLESFQFDKAATLAYDFFWNDFSAGIHILSTAQGMIHFYAHTIS